MSDYDTYNDGTLPREAFCLQEIREVALLVRVDEDEVEWLVCGQLLQRVCRSPLDDCDLVRYAGMRNVLSRNLVKLPPLQSTWVATAPFHRKSKSIPSLRIRITA